MKDYDYWSRIIERAREVREAMESKSYRCEHGDYRSLCPECSGLR